MYKTGIITNTTAGTFHPIYFRMAPLPGGAELSSGHQRYKSAFHHTGGFKTIDEAEANIVSAAGQPDSPVAGTTDSGRRWEWDGESVPAIVDFF